MGPQTVKALIDKGIIQDEADIFYLKPEPLLDLEKFAQKKVDNLLNAIEKAKSRPLAQVIASLGIDGVGGSVSELLASHFGSMEALMSANVDVIDALEGIGEVLARNIVDWFNDEQHQHLITKLRQAGVTMEAEQVAPTSDKFAGLTFVLTGTLPTLTREAAEDLIKSHGGKVSGSVSKKTSYVLVGDSPGSKAEKAAQLGVQMISEADLHALLG
jgi:DNA ligase (NAD+)